MSRLLRAFPEIESHLSALAGATFGWCVAGGWAIDMFLGRKTRAHADFEIAIDREDQGRTREYFSGWLCAKVVPSTEAVAWGKDEILELPLHELHVENGGIKIEILLNEFTDGAWVFRRDPRIIREAGLFSLPLDGGPRILSPEIVLLYKAKINRDPDRADLLNAVPQLSESQRSWLQESLALAYPGHEWLSCI
jgi:hypothetical protein